MRVALDIPALSPGWQGSFRELLAAADAGARRGRAIGTEPAWPGFRPLRVVESAGEPHRDSSAGRTRPARRCPRPGPASTSPSGSPTRGPAGRAQLLPFRAPGAGTYRISVKREEGGLASRWLHEHAHVGDTLDVAAPRGEFTLAGGDGPVRARLGRHRSHPGSCDAARSSPPTRRPGRCGGSTQHEDRRIMPSPPRPLTWSPACPTRACSCATAARPRAGYRRGPAEPSVRPLDAEAFTAAGVPADADAYLCGPERS